MISLNLNLNAQVKMLDSQFKKPILFACKELKIDSIEIIVSYSRFDTLLKYKEPYIARVVQLSDRLFCINIDDNTWKEDIIRASLHEVCHIRQILDKRLVIYKYAIWFEGVVYKNSTPMDKRKWEDEATSNEYKLWCKYKKLNR